MSVILIYNQLKGIDEKVSMPEVFIGLNCRRVSLVMNKGENHESKSIRLSIWMALSHGDDYCVAGFILPAIAIL